MGAAEARVVGVIVSKSIASWSCSEGIKGVLNEAWKRIWK